MAETDQTNGPNPDKLKDIVERIEAIDQDRRDLNADKSQLMKDAKDEGFNIKAIKELIRYRKMDPAIRENELEELEVYADALGMQLRLPILDELPKAKRSNRKLEAVG